MATSVLRVSGPIDIDECFSWLPQDRLEAVWRRGETWLGREHPISGFNLRLAESDDVSEGAQEAMETFRKLAPRIRELVRPGASADVDVALFVEAVASRSESFPASLL